MYFSQRHLTGEMQDFADLPYSWDKVSDFQRKVYQAALSVKPGQTCSYGYPLAAASGNPSMSRKVGRALERIRGRFSFHAIGSLERTGGYWDFPHLAE